jgi:hypothetical protein
MRLYDIQLLKGKLFGWELRYFLIQPPTNAHEDRRARRHIERFYDHYVAWGNPNGYVEPITTGYDIVAVMRELEWMVSRFEQRQLPDWTSEQYCTNLLCIYWRLVRFMEYPGVDLWQWTAMIDSAHTLVTLWIDTHNPFAVHNWMRKPAKYWHSRGDLWDDLQHRADIQRQERQRLRQLVRQPVLEVVEAEAEVLEEAEPLPQEEIELEANPAPEGNQAAVEAMPVPMADAMESPYVPIEEAEDAEDPVDMADMGPPLERRVAEVPTDEAPIGRLVGVSVELDEDVLLLSSASSTTSTDVARREVFVYLTSELDTSAESATASMFLGFALERLANSCTESVGCDCRRCWLSSVKRQRQDSDTETSETEGDKISEVSTEEDACRAPSEPRSTAGEIFAEWPSDVPPVGVFDVGVDEDAAVTLWGRLLTWIDSLPASPPDDETTLVPSAADVREEAVGQWQMSPFVPNARDIWWEGVLEKVRQDDRESRDERPVNSVFSPRAVGTPYPTRGLVPPRRAGGTTFGSDNISLRGRLRGRRPIPDIMARYPPNGL